MTVGDIILSHPWHYQITRYQNKFVVISGADSRVVFETSDLVDAKTAFEYARDQMTNLGKKCVIKADGGYAERFEVSAKITLDSNDQFQCWQGLGGPRGTSSHIRTTANQPIFELTGGAGFNSFVDLYLGHNISTYSTGLIRFLDRSIGNQINGCRFSDFSNYKGYCVAMEILGTGSGLSQYKNHIINCESTGFEAFKFYNANKVNSGADYFISNNMIRDTDVWDAKNIIKATGISGGKIIKEVLNNVSYQYNTANPLTTGQAVLELDNPSNMSYWSMSDVFVWDIPSDVNYANVGTALELGLVNCFPSDRIGGSGASLNKVKRWDYYTHMRGTSNIAGEYNKRDYTITHNLGKLPRWVGLTVTNNDTNAILYAVVPKSLITTTQFTVRFPEPPPLPNRSGVLNLDLAWEVVF